MSKIINNNKDIQTDDVIEILKSVYDPDIDYSIYDIGLIYEIEITDIEINIVMTLTSVNCPEAQSLPENVEKSLQEKFQHLKIHVEITFEPAWTIDNMTDEIKLSLGLL
jgi:metal-sulfur cluster biosynthetic enzyme